MGVYMYSRCRATRQMFMYIILGFLTFVCLSVFRKKRNIVHIDGFIAEGFEPVAEVFRKNLEDGWERDGASFSIYHRKKLVVDIWGGYADRESERKWKQTTLQIIFSSSKALGAICIAILVDRGLLKYSDRICSFWPDFARKGKEMITVEMVLSHTAGLAAFDREVSIDEATNPELMAKAIENLEPYWSPGKESGYHALTYGWLVDQIIRKVDSQGRGSGAFWREEVAEKHNLDVHIGLPKEESWRVARISHPSIWNRIDEIWTDPSSVNYWFALKEYSTNGLARRVVDNPSWIRTIWGLTVNNAELYQIEQPAALAIANTKDLARLGQLLLEGQIIKLDSLHQLSESVVHKQDIISGCRTNRSRGTTIVDYNGNGIRMNLIGHTGLGGQNFRWNEDQELSFAYLSNGLKGGLGDRARPYLRVVDSLMACVSRHSILESK